MNKTKMTLTERNQKLYELRKKLDQRSYQFIIDTSEEEEE